MSIRPRRYTDSQLYKGRAKTFYKERQKCTNVATTVNTQGICSIRRTRGMDYSIAQLKNRSISGMYIITDVRNMSQIYMITCARQAACKRALYKAYQDLDGKRAIYAREIGKGGYEHWQCRMECSGDLRQWVDRNGLGWHVDIANDVWNYEQKGGDYWNTWDSVEVRKIRYGKLRPGQVELYRSVAKQNNRMVTIWIDRKGGFGKTHAFLRGVLRGEVLPVPAAGIHSTKLSSWVLSAWSDQPIIWIDIPRAHKIDEHLWEAIEEVKGIAYEWRYKSSWIVTSGVKVLVTTNTELSKKDLSQLSEDRWDVHYIEELTT